MSKELEAIEKIRTVLGENLGIWICEEYAILVQTLTPPTADEVCEALSEWLKKEVPDLFNYKVYYDNGGFHYYNNKDYEVYLVDYDEIFETMTLSVFLPSHLITLIGRFYEGEMK